MFIDKISSVSFCVPSTETPKHRNPIHYVPGFPAIRGLFLYSRLASASTFVNPDTVLVHKYSKTKVRTVFGDEKQGDLPWKRELTCTQHAT